MAAAAKAELILTVIAAAVLTSFRGVSIGGVLPAAGATSLGFSMTGGAIGDAVPVATVGTAVAEAGAAVALGAALELDASGRVVTKASGVTVGRALSAAGAAGALIEVLLIPN